MADIGNLNSFGNFIEDSNLSQLDRIQRDLLNFLRQHVGGSAFDRAAGSMLSQAENESNHVLLDALLKSIVVSAVAKYNMQTTPELQAVVGSDMVAIKRENENISIFVVFVPLQQPAVENLRYFEFSV